MDIDNSSRLLTVRGIDIITYHLPLILIWAALQFWPAQWGRLGRCALFGVIVIILLFVIVTLHELGHSVAAQHYGVPVRQIVLLPIGALPSSTISRRRPGREFVMPSPARQ